MTVEEMILFLRLERPVLFFDLETTGPNPREDRIVEIGLIQIRPDGQIKRWRSLVNPGRPIPKEATAKHHIDDQRMTECLTCGQPKESHPLIDAPRPADGSAGCFVFKPVPTFKDLAKNLLVGFTDTDFGGFNVKTFDVVVMEEEFKREGIEWKLGEARIVDGYRLWQIVQPRTLSDFVREFTGKELDDAHTALADIEGTLAGFLGLLTRHPELPRDLAQLHELQWPKKVKQPHWIDDDGKFQWKDGKAICAFGKKHAGKPMSSVERSFYKWMLDQDFSPSTKQVCSDYLKGIMPKQPAETPLLPAEDAE